MHRVCICRCKHANFCVEVFFVCAIYKFSFIHSFTRIFGSNNQINSEPLWEWQAASWHSFHAPCIHRQSFSLFFPIPWDGGLTLHNWVKQIPPSVSAMCRLYSVPFPMQKFIARKFREVAEGTNHNSIRNVLICVKKYAANA